MPDDVRRLPEITKYMVAEIDGAIGWITFNKPERRNAVSTDMWEALPKILDDFEANPAVRVIVLKGAGDKAFVSGADISQFEQARNTPEQVAEYERFVESCSDRLRHVGKPTISMIRGWCVGGGVAITLNTDIRICSDDSRFAIPAAKLGLGYRVTGINKLVAIVGPAFAKEIFFTARAFSADEAERMGLVNRVVPAAELEDYVRQYCATIADNAPMTILAVKREVEEIIGKVPGHVDRDLCDTLVKACFASADYKEGRTAFMEKRKPAFQGR
ncbi:MAG: enoyl-CoA hydratase/isomerase family protein [Alphaproteobacteria bacterium]|nr:enoyl-CoA hydratase/isomerase family protein [Alphaproteobacteria bacterium]